MCDLDFEKTKAFFDHRNISLEMWVTYCVFSSIRHAVFVVLHWELSESKSTFQSINIGVTSVVFKCSILLWSKKKIYILQVRYFNDYALKLKSSWKVQRMNEYEAQNYTLCFYYFSSNCLQMLIEYWIIKKIYEYKQFQIKIRPLTNFHTAL